MNKCDVANYVKMLDWHNPIETQNNAIEVLSRIDDANIYYVFDKCAKDTWENAVKVIKKMGFPKNKPLLGKLVWLLQDVNWPGAVEAMNILSLVDKKIIIPIIKDALCIANKNDDLMWIGGINMLLENVEWDYENSFDENILKILQRKDF